MLGNIYTKRNNNKNTKMYLPEIMARSLTALHVGSSKDDLNTQHSVVPRRRQLSEHVHTVRRATTDCSVANEATTTTQQGRVCEVKGREGPKEEVEIKGR
jgi:hypothetical protein